MSESKLFEFKWNDGIGSRGRKPSCLIITPSGVVHEFKGSSIPGVVQVVKTQYHKNGKWSNTDYFCASPEGTKVYAWRQSFEDGLSWPEASWEEAFETVKRIAPQVDIASLEAVIRARWSKAAEKFDENRAALVAFAAAASEPTLVPAAPVTKAETTTTTTPKQPLGLVGALPPSKLAGDEPATTQKVETPAVKVGEKVYLGNIGVEVVELAPGLLAVSALAHELVFTDESKLAPNPMLAMLIKSDPAETPLETTETFSLVATEPRPNEASLKLLKEFSAKYPGVRIVSSGMGVAAFKRDLPGLVIGPITTPETSRLDNSLKRVYKNKWQA